MGSRRDALTAFAELALAVEQIGIAHHPDGRATIGMVQVIPGSRNVVPGRVECSVEFRHPQSSALEAMEQALHRAAAELAGRGVPAEVERILTTPRSLSTRSVWRAASGRFRRSATAPDAWSPAPGMIPAISARSRPPA